MIWKKTNEDFQHYLRLQRGLSENTAVSYGLDIEKLIQYLEKRLTISARTPCDNLYTK